MSRPARSSFVLKLLLLAFLLAPALTGCSYLTIPAKDDVSSWPLIHKGKNDAPVYNSAVIKGRITGAPKDTSTIIVAQPAAVNWALTDWLAVHPSGSFMFYLPQGRYHLYTFTDYNRDGTYQTDELSGAYGSFSSPAEIAARENELVNGIVIPVERPAGRATLLPADSAIPKAADIVRQMTQNGQVLKIYHEYFAAENAQTGYWRPSSFLKALGAHIYLTEEYTPRKIPVLFVHGTEGSPHNWIYLYLRMDRSRYQPWFFYYPSGIRLGLAAALLKEELSELHQKYRFPKMGLVAHSVGGLTSRSFLTRFAGDNDLHFIKLFITFATPWSGFSAADASQIITHKSIPVWMDLGTQSPFIKTTLAGKLPPGVRHYIFYGNNDTLCGNKALDDRATAVAVEAFAFESDHTSILSDRKASLKFNEILNRELGNSKK
ncbi:MAG: alpha/beta hydrolase [Deltaproteobacteria bacterium]|nr:alpha/beta hydrolase [Deltaproteobacteria bacterium]